jgi:hypothetical protein
VIPHFVNKEKNATIGIPSQSEQSISQYEKVFVDACSYELPDSVWTPHKANGDCELISEIHYKMSVTTLYSLFNLKIP